MSGIAAAAGQREPKLAVSVRQAPKLAGETTTIAGNGVPGRAVELQRRRDGRWTVDAARVAKRSGSVVFKLRVPQVAADYRLVARPADGARGGRPEILSSSVRLAPAAPRVQLEIEGAPVGRVVGGRSATPGLASFWPARPGAPVTIQRREGGKWVGVVSGRQDSGGRFPFQVMVRGSSPTDRFRAVSRPPRALRAMVGQPVLVTNRAASFSEDFNGPALTSVWAQRSSLGTGRACVTTSDAYRLRNDSLQLLALPDAAAQPADDSCPYGRYRNGHVGSQNSFAFRYGYAAARIKFSPAQGQHGGFWLQPRREAQVPALAPENNGAEIDVAEYFGDNARNGALGQWVHYYRSNSDGSIGRGKAGGLRPNLDAIVGPGVQMSADYHVFSVEWTPHEYVFRIDGVITWRTSEGVSRQPQYLILSMLTSDWELPRLSAELPSPMSVDWVKVWQR